MSSIPKKIRDEVHERSGGLCEACWGDRAEHVHHRKLKSQGGTNDLINLLDVSFDCHSRIHNGGNASYDAGLMVRSYLDPAVVPVQLLAAIV